MKRIFLAILTICAVSANALAQSVTTAPYNSTAQLTGLQMPSGLGWDMTRFPLSVAIYDAPAQSRTTGVVYNGSGATMTPENLFNSVSTALSSPHIIYYVATTGSDSNACTSAGSPCATINHAVTLANTDAHPDEIIINAGIYPRASSPGGTSGVSPTTDIAFVAAGGRVTTGTFDTTWSASADLVYTNTYSYTTANTDRVIDTTQTNRFGNYIELTTIPTGSGCPAIVNRTPESWCLYSGTQYINRQDGQQPKPYGTTGGNTIVTRGGAYGFVITSQVNIYIGDGGSQTNFPSNGFDVIGAGGGYQGGLEYAITTPNNSIYNTIVASNSTFKYAGGAVGTAGRGVAIESINGMAAMFNVDASEAQTDGFNLHDTNGASETQMLVLNGTVNDGGRSGTTSDNCLTNHDTTVMIGVSVSCENEHGGSLRSTNFAKAWFAGVSVKNDLGDIVLGGTTPQDAVSTQLNSTFWLDRVKIDMPAGTIGVMTETNTASIYLRNVWPPPGVIIGGPGTIAGY